MRPYGSHTAAWTLLLGAALLVTTLAACGSARRGAPTQPPLVLADAEAQQGERVFMTYCNGCHPRGAGGLGPGINDKPLPGFLIRFQVRHGLGTMPAFKDDVISDEELDALVTYLVTLRRHDG